MEVIPAIDLRGGRCVRLYQGDFDKETVYSEDPVEVALRWQQQGAPRLHVVDLDGAASGSFVNGEVVGRITAAVGIPVQVGGGIRSLEMAERLANMGAQRVVIGTAAVEDPDLVKEACHRLGTEAVIVGVDARDGHVAVKGWTENTRTSAREVMQAMARAGVRRFVYTDIARDGTLTEPNFHAIAEAVESTGVSLIASGGISSVAHLRRLAGMGVEGAIVGTALYTGALDLKEALEELK